MQIAGLQKTTLVDFPGKVAATVFTRGCTFACPFCHNPELVLPEKFEGALLDENELFEFFEKRKNQLQGVCITGGEPTLQKDLIEFIQKLKNLGYLVKLDTNGWNAVILERIIKTGMLDYIAMDIKTTLGKYASVVNPKKNLNQNDQNQDSNAVDCHSRPAFDFTHALSVAERDPESSVTCHPEPPLCHPEPQAKDLAKRIKKSIDLIMSSGIDYEFRTTVCHPIHEIEDFEEIGKLIKGTKRYFIQNFVKSKHIDEHQKFEPFSDEELIKIEKIMQKYVGVVNIR